MLRNLDHLDQYLLNPGANLSGHGGASDGLVEGARILWRVLYPATKTGTGSTSSLDWHKNESDFYRRI
ncbi:MAG: hypothetical protein ACO3DQ_07100, partial [Cephaloticoccus sp.]